VPSGPNSQRDWRPGFTTPPAAIAAIREEDAGRLWVLAAVAKPDWKRAYESSDPPGYMMFDTVIEVLDVTRRSVIARTRVPRFALGFVGNDIFTYEELENGAPVITVWRMQLDGI
jgi:hypothetical protein